MPACRSDWASVAQSVPPVGHVVLIHNPKYLYPVVGHYAGEGYWILEEGGPEAASWRRYPMLNWEPTHWAELPAGPS